MTTEAITCHILRCDLKVSPECEPVFIDRENEGFIHGETPEQVRKWATSGDYDGDWIAFPDGRDACSACKQHIKDEPHTFVPDGPSSSTCLVCDEWATEGPHGLDVVPGQLEVSAR